MSAVILSAPKESAATSLVHLKSLVNDDNAPEAAKTVGGGIVKIFMTGALNFYLHDSPSLRKWLFKNYHLEP